MKNNEYVRYIITKSGRIPKIYRREKDGWTQTSSNGTIRPLIVEQLLSHILPPLAGISSAKVKVERNDAFAR